MKEDNTAKESGGSATECTDLTDSPYVGGNKMSSSLKKRLKCVRMHSSPLARPSTFTVPVAPRSIKFENLTDANVKGCQKVCYTYSRQDIERAMNEPVPEENAWNEPDEKITQNVLKRPDSVINEDELAINEDTWNEIHSKVNEHYMNMPDSRKNENTMNQSDPEINKNFVNESEENTIEIIVKENYMNKSDSEKNENTMNQPDPVINENVVNEIDKNAMDKPDPEVNDSACSYSKQGFKNGIDESHAQINENICQYSMEAIENCIDKDKLLEIHLNLQKEAVENEELLRKLKLVQKHHSKNNPDALTDLTKKWLTCTQMALTKLYSMMPIPRSISFEHFLIFLQIDFDLVKYNPESDTFS